MSWKGFVHFIKQVFDPQDHRQYVRSQRPATSGDAQFAQVLRSEGGHPAGHVSPLHGDEQPAQNTLGHRRSEVHTRIHSARFIPLPQQAERARKFFPLKAYRDAAKLASLSTNRPLASPVSLSDGYPPEVRRRLLGKQMVSHRAGSGAHWKPVAEDDLGRLCARFESGSHGVASIGYDPYGGTSYGTYQIASRTGSMDMFIHYLEKKQPRWAARLKAAGPADTGSRHGHMPRVWKQIAGEDSHRFARLQHDFVKTYFHQPALKAIYRNTGLRIDNRSPALQQVLWSTSVQHGPAGARKIFTQAVNMIRLRHRKVTDEALIHWVYKIRDRRGSKLGLGLKAALSTRFRQEKQMALAMLRNRRFSA